MGWADDPELVATFRAEVEERLASLSDGLLALEGHASPRQLVGALFRDAHTVKGSARMLGLDPVVSIAHRCEDLLGALRDGRLTVRRDLVDLLLVATEAIGRALPGAAEPIPDSAFAEIVAALDAALTGTDPVTVPRLASITESNPLPVEDPVVATRAGESVRVPTRRVHGLLDAVGEAELDVRRVERSAATMLALVAEQQDLVRALRQVLLRADSGLDGELSDAATGLVAAGDQLRAAAREVHARTEDAAGRISRVREGAMGLAMVPVRRVVAGFPALVREVANATGKQVTLRTVGADVELDVRVLDGVADALRHLVTNAIDHGLEAPADRRATGKHAEGVVTVSARQAGSNVVLEVADDGRGIDTEALRAQAIAKGLLPADSDAIDGALHRVLFEPGFTTCTTVTETSGRGVGLDVVRSAVEDLGGTVEVRTAAGEGTGFVLTLPVTLGVLHCLMVRCGQDRYAVPLAGVLETVTLADTQVHDVAGSPVLVRDEQSVPLRDLAAAVGAAGENAPRAAIVFRSAGTSVAWAVEALEGEREVVVKQLGSFLGHYPGCAGATIDSDGTPMLLLDLRELGAVGPAGRPGRAPATGTAAPLAREGPGEAGRTGTGPARVLVVEDSIGVRELQRTILEAAGYTVVTAVDGLDGAARLQQPPVDLVLSDVEMPGMDGFTLTRAIRKARGWENVPVVIMTSRGDDADKRAGLDAGADAYLLKSEFDQHALVSTVRRLVGR
jgi:chemotaxis protein histidine kinase CheA